MQNEMQVLDHTGHTKVEWNPDIDAEVASARAVFNEMTGKGYRAFTVNNGKSRRIENFDPDLAEMVLVPHLQGG